MADVEALGDVDGTVVEADGLAFAVAAAAIVFVNLPQKGNGVFFLVQEKVQVSPGDLGARPFIRAERG